MAYTLPMAGEDQAVKAAAKSKKKKARKARKGQAQVDPVAMAKQLGENQQAIMQTPEAKQRFKDTQDPFKNGFFKKTEQPAFDPAKARNAVDVAKQEQTNAQKLFAPATPDIQTDAQGNKLAMRNGQPVGFGTGQRKVGDAAPVNADLAQGIGSTDAETAARRGQIQDFAGKFSPALPAVPQQSPNAEQFSMPRVTQAPAPTQQIMPTRVAPTPQGLPNDTPGNWADQSREQGLMAGMVHKGAPAPAEYLPAVYKNMPAPRNPAYDAWLARQPQVPSPTPKLFGVPLY